MSMRGKVSFDKKKRLKLNQKKQGREKMQVPQKQKKKQQKNFKEKKMDESYYCKDSLQLLIQNNLFFIVVAIFVNASLI